MKWSIRSYLERSANLNKQLESEDQSFSINASDFLNLSDSSSGSMDSSSTVFDMADVKSQLQYLNAKILSGKKRLSFSGKDYNFLELCNSKSTPNLSDTSVEKCLTSAPSGSSRRMSVVQEEPPPFVLKSILKPPTEKLVQEEEEEEEDPNNHLIVNKQVWQAAGYLWKETPTPSETEFMLYMWDMIKNDWDLITVDEIIDSTPEYPEPVYDLETYEIIERTPSVIDLTIYDIEDDEYGLFYNQNFMVDQRPPEGSPHHFAVPNILVGIRVIKNPVLQNVKTFAKISDSYELAPVFWKSQQMYTGVYKEDTVAIEAYKKQQLAMVEKFRRKECQLSNRILEENKNGTWRLLVTEVNVDVDKKPKTSDEIQKIFGLTDDGSILLNVDHIPVIQGKCGLNRGKASKRFPAVPVGKDPLKTSFLKQLKTRLAKFCFGSNPITRLIRSVFGHPRNKTLSGGPGESVGAYALSLADDPTSTFSRNIENFITCTKDSREMSPQIMMRNMRQFMSGMKNYLVKHGEGDFHQEVQRACSRLKPDEFLNLDTILENVMHKLVVLPLREHLYGLFVDYYTKSGDIQLLVENVKFALGKTAVDIGIRKEVTPPSDPAMRNISLIIQRLQEAELPLEKLELLMAAVSTIFETTGCPKGQALNADDFLPLLVYVVAKTGFVGAEIEAEFMWGLLQPSLLSGEAGYYLTALCSAVHVLKTFKESQNEGTGTIDWRSSSMPTCSSVLRVIIPDEYNGSLQTRTLPVRPHTTTKEVCRIIAHKARITNPQDYGLFKLVDGEETLLLETECPQDARLAARGKHCLLAYKRIEAKIAWPSSANFH